jgi:hypothetical protein
VISRVSFDLEERIELHDSRRNVICKARMKINEGRHEVGDREAHYLNHQMPTWHAADLGEATTMTLTHENVVTTRSQTSPHHNHNTSQHA